MTLSRASNQYIFASAALCAAGALVHLAAIVLGPDWYAFIGAPRGLIRMLGHGSSRPAVTCVAISSLLALWSAYGLSAIGFVGPLPARRVVLALVAALLISRSVVLPVLSALAPEALAGICGRCGEPNLFVFFTSALCLFIGVGFAVAAARLNSATVLVPLSFLSGEHHL